MSKAGQAPELQAKRLAQGRCPVHGFAFAQVGGWYRLEGAERPVMVGRCARRTCPIHVLQETPGGPAVPLDTTRPLHAYACTRFDDTHGTVQWACAEELVEVWPAALPR